MCHHGMVANLSLRSHTSDNEFCNTVFLRLHPPPSMIFAAPNSSDAINDIIDELVSWHFFLPYILTVLHSKNLHKHLILNPDIRRYSMHPDSGDRSWPRCWHLLGLFLRVRLFIFRCDANSAKHLLQSSILVRFWYLLA